MFEVTISVENQLGGLRPIQWSLMPAISAESSNPLNEKFKEINPDQNWFSRSNKHRRLKTLSDTPHVKITILRPRMIRRMACFLICFMMGRGWRVPTTHHPPPLLVHWPWLGTFSIYLIAIEELSIDLKSPIHLKSNFIAMLGEIRRLIQAYFPYHLIFKWLYDEYKS